MRTDVLLSNASDLNKNQLLYEGCQVVNEVYEVLLLGCRRSISCKQRKTCCMITPGSVLLFVTCLGTVHLIFGGGGGSWDILEKKFLALILTLKNYLAQWHSEKNNLSPIVQPKLTYRQV